MRPVIALFVSLFLSVFSVASQEILTADRYLAMVGERYAALTDYQAKVVIESAKVPMKGTLIHKRPSLLRIDFTQPAEQVVAYNGESLTVYLPEYRAVLSQNSSTSAKSMGPALATSQGLSTLRRNYTAAFAKSPDPVPLDDKNPESVIKLVLTRRSLSEGFREIRLSISPGTKLIRRLEGRTIADELVMIDFLEMVVDQGIPEARFVYDSPASANMYNNFLFKENE